MTAARLNVGMTTATDGAMLYATHGTISPSPPPKKTLQKREQAPRAEALRRVSSGAHTDSDGATTPSAVGCRTTGRFRPRTASAGHPGRCGVASWITSIELIGRRSMAGAGPNLAQTFVHVRDELEIVECLSLRLCQCLGAYLPVVR